MVIHQARLHGAVGYSPDLVGHVDETCRRGQLATPESPQSHPVSKLRAVCTFAGTPKSLRVLCQYHCGACPVERLYSGVLSPASHSGSGQLDCC